MGFNHILLLLAGVGVFIAGMNMLSGGLEKSAGSGLKKLLGKISNNRFAGVGVGAGVTAVIQSSSATSVMVIGFVNAGVISLMQATSIIMGANIGTTITGIIVSLKALPIDEVASAFAFVGVMMMFFKSEKVKQIGGVLCGFGLIFVGLELMSDSLSSQEIKDFFINLFQKIDFPLLLVLCGMIFTAVIQSSSAATGIFITMVGTGVLGLEGALFLVLGSNIGTCVTAIMACIGANTNAKRTACIHLLFNVIGSIAFIVLLLPLKSQVVWLLSFIPGGVQMQLAWFHVTFNIVTTLLLLPFVKQLVKIAEIVVKEKKTDDEKRQLKFVNNHLLKTPSIALMQVKKEIEYMLSVVHENLEKSFLAMEEKAESYKAELIENEAIIDFTNNSLNKYLISLSPLLDLNEANEAGAFFHVLNDLERIGDHAENFGEIGVQMQQKGLVFSSLAKEELDAMKQKVLKMFELAQHVFDNNDSSKLLELTELENQVDALKKELSAKHYDRLAKGTCVVEHSPYFTSIVIGLERVADHLVNVGYSIVSPIGSQTQK